MRTITQKNVGGPEVLVIAEERRSPTPGPGEMLVRIAAAGINPVDAAVRAGYYRLLGNPPFTVGWDISGTVEALGSGVDGLAVGDEVFGMPRFPEPGGRLRRKDRRAGRRTGAESRRASTICRPRRCRWPASRHGRAWSGRRDLKSGQRVLIHGAAGGVGHLAVQIAKALRRRRSSPRRAPSKLEFVRGLGADEGDRLRQGMISPSMARDIDVALETIGGDHALETLKSLKPGGVLVSLLEPGEAAKAEAKQRGIRLERISVQARPRRPGRAGASGRRRQVAGPCRADLPAGRGWRGAGLSGHQAEGQGRADDVELAILS